MKERYQEIDEKNDELRSYLDAQRERGSEFLERFEMSWIYHDSALEGVIYTSAELSAALHPGAMGAEASLVPIVLEVRNHQAVVSFIRDEAKLGGKKHSALSLATIKRMHDLFSGNTPEAHAARAANERREKSDKELAKEKERAGFRRDMPLHRTYFHEIAQPAKIPGLVEKLVESTGSSEFREFHPIKQAATVQYQLLQIFPFADHSGKVARMCSNLVFLRHNYLPCVIHSIDRQRYYESLRAPIATFRGLLMDAVENSLDNALKYFRSTEGRHQPRG